MWKGTAGARRAGASSEKGASSMEFEEMSINLPAGRNVDNMTVRGSHHPAEVSRRLGGFLSGGKWFVKSRRETFLSNVIEK